MPAWSVIIKDMHVFNGRESWRRHRPLEGVHEGPVNSDTHSHAPIQHEDTCAICGHTMGSHMFIDPDLVVADVVKGESTMLTTMAKVCPGHVIVRVIGDKLICISPSLAEHYKSMMEKESVRYKKKK